LSKTLAVLGLLLSDLTEIKPPSLSSVGAEAGSLVARFNKPDKSTTE